MSKSVERVLHVGHSSYPSLPGLSRQSRAACSVGNFERFECCSCRGKCISTSIVAANGIAHHERVSVSPLDARDKPGHDVVVGSGPAAEDNGVSMMERRASAAKGMVA